MVSLKKCQKKVLNNFNSNFIFGEILKILNFKNTLKIILTKYKFKKISQFLRPFPSLKKKSTNNFCKHFYKNIKLKLMKGGFNPTFVCIKKPTRQEKFTSYLHDG